MTEFEQKVREMRDLQKVYFSSRDPKTLRAAKAAEKDVDDMLLRIEREERQMVFDFEHEQSNK